MKFRWKQWSALWLTVILLLSAAGCSDMVLNSDGTISGPNGPLVLETDTNGRLSFDTEPESETVQSIGYDADPYADAAHRLYVEFLQTGKSDSILIRADGQVILMDTGDSGDWDTIDGALQSRGITAIDVLILTHYDNDHIGCVAKLLSKYRVDCVYMPDYVRKSSLYRKMAEKLETLGDAVHRLYAEDVELDVGCAHLWINATGLEGHDRGAEVGSDEDNTDAEENNFSLITYLTFGNISLLLCGDAEGERMSEYMPLYQDKGLGTVTLCKIPHHGASADKGELAALDILKPRYSVIHTDAASSLAGAIVTKIKAVFSAPYYTFNGTVTFSSDGQTWVIGQ